jgi:hypothetical protein
MIGYKCHCGSEVVRVLKLVEITIIMVVGCVEDEKTFSTINFMKSKLCNCLTTHFDLVVQMYAQKFYKLETFPFYTTIKEWGKEKLWYGKE